MQLPCGGVDLAYCTNIFPARGWDQVWSHLRRYAPEVKRRVAPHAPFGLGLRLSNAEAVELQQGDRLDRLAGWLAGEGMYVHLINGFPFGDFHDSPVKEQVFAPDWRRPERLAYTLRLAQILARLIPAGSEGGISTVPLSYSPWIRDRDAAFAQIAISLADAVDALLRLRDEQGVAIHLDIEPEPDGLVQSTAELADFFERWLLGAGAEHLARVRGFARSEAVDHLLGYVRACLDACHMAVQFEDVEESLRRITDSGIRIGRVQLSAALRIPLAADPQSRRRTLARLSEFYEPVYLHQVRVRREDGLRLSPDLPAAEADLLDPGAQQARIHFHVPLFAAGDGELESTRDSTRQLLQLILGRRLTPHLEIETYTWSVLPRSLQQDLVASIAAEYAWVLERCAAQAESSPIGVQACAE